VWVALVLVLVLAVRKSKLAVAQNYITCHNPKLCHRQYQASTRNDYDDFESRSASNQLDQLFRRYNYTPLHSQQILHSTAYHKNVDAVIMTETRQQVPGDNPAYFCGPTPPNQQLFEIEEFIIAPNPPEVYVISTYLPHSYILKF